MQKQIENKKVWYFNAKSRTIQTIGGITSVPEGEFDILKIIQIGISGNVRCYAIQDSQVENFFIGYNRIATEKQIDECLTRTFDLLDGDTSNFKSKWEI
jgi:hypothetical protein